MVFASTLVLLISPQQTPAPARRGALHYPLSLWTIGTLMMRCPTASVVKRSDQLYVGDLCCLPPNAGCAHHVISAYTRPPDLINSLPSYITLDWIGGQSIPIHLTTDVLSTRETYTKGNWSGCGGKSFRTHQGSRSCQGSKKSLSRKHIYIINKQLW